MKVLIATALWPTSENPAFGSFVRAQCLALQRAGVDLEFLVLRGRYRKLIYPKGVFQLQRRLCDRSIDLVHAHYGYVGMIARTQVKVPLVVTYHGDDVLGKINAQGKTTHFSKVMASLGCALGRFVDGVIVQTKQMADRFQRSNVHIIPHEVDFEIFHPVDRARARAILGLDPHRKYLLFAANPAIAVKRFPLAKKVACELSKEYGGLELLVVHKESQPNLALYMSACDALVFPSYQEGSPNIVKQAMACNLPIVATAAGDVPQIISNTDGCYVCLPKVSEFCFRLRMILDSGERTSGCDHVRHFDGANVAGRLIQVYEDILRKRCSPSLSVNRKVI
jgi:glycosyltransferase involved in cell wall biosynthesis